MNLKILLSIAISAILIVNPLFAAKDNKKNLKRSTVTRSSEVNPPKKKVKISYSDQKKLDLIEEQKNNYPNPIIWEDIIKHSLKLTSKESKNYIKNDINTEKDRNVFLNIFKRLYNKNLSLNDNYFIFTSIAKYMKLYYFTNEDTELHLIEAIENIMKNSKFDKSIALELLNAINLKKIPNDKTEIVKNFMSEITQEDDQSFFALAMFRYILSNYNKLSDTSMQNFAKKIRPYKNLLTVQGLNLKKYLTFGEHCDTSNILNFLHYSATQESKEYIQSLNQNEAEILKKILNQLDEKSNKNDFLQKLSSLSDKFPHLYLKNFSTAKNCFTCPIATFFEKSTFYTMNETELNIFLNDYVPLFKEKLGEFWKDAVNASALLTFVAIEEKCALLINEEIPNEIFQRHFILFLLDSMEQIKIKSEFSKKIDPETDDAYFRRMSSSEITQYISEIIDIELNSKLIHALITLTKRNLLTCILKNPNNKTLNEILNLHSNTNFLNDLINNLRNFETDDQNHKNYNEVLRKICKKLFTLNLNLKCEKTTKDLTEFIKLDVEIIKNLHKKIMILHQSTKTAFQSNSLLSKYKIKKNEEIKNHVASILRDLSDNNHADYLKEIEKQIESISAIHLKTISTHRINPLPKNLIPIFAKVIPEFTETQINTIPFLIFLFMTGKENMVENMDLVNSVFNCLGMIFLPNMHIRINEIEKKTIANAFRYIYSYKNLITNETEVENKIFSDFQPVDAITKKRSDTLLEIKDYLQKVLRRITSQNYTDRQSAHTKKSHADVDNMIQNLCKEFSLKDYTAFTMTPPELFKTNLTIRQFFTLAIPNYDLETYNIFFDILSIPAEKNEENQTNMFSVNIHPKEMDLNNKFSKALEDYYTQFLNNPKISKDEKEISFREIFNKFCVHITENKRLSDKDPEMLPNEINTYIDAFLSYHAKATICKIIKICILSKDNFSDPIKGNYVKGLFPLLLRTILKIQNSTNDVIDLQDKFLTLRNNLAYANIEYVDEKIRKNTPFQEALLIGEACPYGMSYNSLEILLNNTTKDKGLKILTADFIPVVMHLIQPAFERIAQLNVSTDEKVKELKNSIVQTLSDPEKYDQEFWDEQKEAHKQIEDIIEGLRDQFQDTNPEIEEEDEIQMDIDEEALSGRVKVPR
ncbi:MAG: hypothetical protein Q8L85_01765 [Alphaproteobacteria bacterium]|nr:hypothetical protein [Alphaproteobacteria bacterium]